MYRYEESFHPAVKMPKHRASDLVHGIDGDGELEKYHDVALGEYSLFLIDQIFIAANILSAITARRDTFIAAENAVKIA